MDMSAPLLELRGIGKSFPGVRALHDVSLDLQAGEVHALLGENGAGKSTLLSCMNGLLRPDEGKILIAGREVQFARPAAAIAARLAMVHQELVLCGNLSVAQNIWLGREIRRAGGRIDRAATRDRTRELLAMVGLDLDPDCILGTLGLAEQQIVEICKALASDPRIIVLDEPTASLDDDQVQRLLGVVRRLRDRGLGIIYVSHRLNEVLELADRMTVLRDGRHVVTRDLNGMTEEGIVSYMVGTNRAGDGFAWSARPIGAPVLEVERAVTRGRLKDVSLRVHAGEIVGVAGLLGCHREELAQAIFGTVPLQSGAIRIDGNSPRLTSPMAAIRAGVAYMPADRKEQGLVLGMSVGENITMTELDRLSRLGLIRRSAARRMSLDLMRRLGIRASGPGQRAGQLSGGNQQKIVIAKWMTKPGRVVIAEDPTRGVDIGAKSEIWGALRSLAEEGRGLLVMTTELQEMMQVCDRIVVMSRGRITGEFTRDAFDVERITACFFS
ncbi:sugar ABC transporter ATP-binding protein [Gemmobacter sp. 24YEA27]|uniref:sugar ABC transporter ATP-binding protein n=1 Tax=Gemmobacter sp. 24YEA27 TaxID=3040672 RepID=UPI0024B3436D|nr:sugar ABC transporter ATP-binding protein [Gemmobacter sp. 24YEA27]